MALCRRYVGSSGRCGGSQGGVVALKEVWLSRSDVGFSGGTNVVALKEVKWRALKEVCVGSQIRVVILRDVARKEMWWLSKQCGGSQPVTCRKTNHRQHNDRIFPKDRLVLAGDSPGR
jgi:hypothetical protein